MKRFIFGLVLFINGFWAFSQKNNLSLEEVSLTPYKFYPQGYHNIKWSPGGNLFAFYDVENNTIVIENTKKQTQEKISLQDINSSSFVMRNVPYSFFWKNVNEMFLVDQNKVFLYNLKSKNIESTIELDQEAQNIDFNNDFSAAAFTKDNNLFFASKDTTIQISFDETLSDIINGQSVSRNEFGISKGTFWSDNGNKLAFYKKDQSNVNKAPLINTATQNSEIEYIAYPMAGQKSEQISLYIYHLDSNKTTKIKTLAENEDYLTNIAWAGDSIVFIAELSRNQKKMKLNSYNAKNGEFIKTLFEENNEKYVEPENPMIFIKERPDQFLWFSDRNGFNQLYHYKIDGTLLGRVSAGVNDVIKYIGYANGKVYYQSAIDNGLDRVIKSTDLKKDYKIEPITELPGTWDGILSPDGKQMLAEFSDIYTPYKLFLIDTKTKKEKELYTAKNPYQDYINGIIKLGSIEKDGIIFNIRTILPSFFDPLKRYPVLVYVYGGPHNQLITNTFRAGADPFLEFIAEQGYIVFTIDNRGSANRGFDFESATHRNLGEIETEDQLTGIEWLIDQSYVNKHKISVYGWSYGGFMALNLILKHPDIFKTAIAGGAVTDWSRYEIMYTERYMDTPQTNPLGYKKSNIIDKAGDLKGNLLLIHGTHDDVVLWQHSQEFLRNSIKNMAFPTYFFYPYHKHGVRGADKLHLNKLILNHLEKNNK